MIKLIIFDWDDVFTSGATNGYFACYHETLVALRVSLPSKVEEKRIKSKWGKTVREELTELLKESPQLINRGEKIYEEILMGNTFVDCLTLTKGSNEFLQRISEKYLLAIASGVNPTLLKEKIFSKFNIKNVFSEIMTVYDLEDPSHAKPHPFMILEILKKLNIKPEETIMVGDAQGDVKMAISAGVTPVVVLTGHLNKQQAETLGVRYIISDVTHLEKLLHDL